MKYKMKKKHKRFVYLKLSHTFCGYVKRVDIKAVDLFVTYNFAF